MTTTIVVLIAIAVLFYGVTAIGGLIAIMMNCRAVGKMMDFLDAYAKPVSAILNHVVDQLDDID